MKACICIVLAGVISGAMGQMGTLNIVVENTGSFSSQITLGVYASADFGTHIVGGEFAIVDGVDTGGIITGMNASTPDWAAVGFNDRGWAGGVNHAGVVFGQFVFLPPFPPSQASSFQGGETLVSTIVVDINRPLTLFDSVQFVLGAGLGPFALEIYDEADGSFTQLGADDVRFGSVGINIPAPSSALMLGIGGVFACRRR